VRTHNISWLDQTTRLTPQFGQAGGDAAWCFVLGRAMGGKIELDFKVEQWSERDAIERVFAICDRADVGLAAFGASVAAYPDKHITLRHGARVIRDSWRAKH